METLLKLGEWILGLILKLGPQRGQKKALYKLWDRIEEKVVPICGAHRVTLIELTNGGGNLKGDSPMYLTIIGATEDERFVKRTPKLNRILLDEFFVTTVRRILKHEFWYVNIYEAEGMVYQFMEGYGSNYVEYHLISRTPRRAVILSLASSDHEGQEIKDKKFITHMEIDKLKK